MLDPAYDCESIRVTSEALTGALLALEGKMRRRLEEAEKAEFSARITRNLLEAYDSGERSSETLNRIALSAMKDSMVGWPTKGAETPRRPLGRMTGARI
jgi:hypothetical protein